MRLSFLLCCQVPLGLLVLHQGISKSDEKIIEETCRIVRQKVGPVASFKKAVVVGKLPKTRSGKISRSTLALMAAGKPFKVRTDGNFSPFVFSNPHTRYFHFSQLSRRTPKFSVSIRQQIPHPVTDFLIGSSRVSFIILSCGTRFLTWS